MMIPRTAEKDNVETSPGGRCPVCAWRSVSIFWEMVGLPVHCNVLCKTREEALGVPRGDIRLAVCTHCGFVYNRAFDVGRMDYGSAYENSLHFSPRFQEYAVALAGRLIERYGLRGRAVLEIACGSGDFLRLLCELGGNRGIGFDPSHVSGGSAQERGDNPRFIREFYSERHADYDADLICCRHALEHIPDPVGFLRMLRDNIGARPDTIVFFEVPNILYTLRDLGVWDIIYEHCSYFGVHSLAQSFELSGFIVKQVTEAFGGQFICLEAVPRRGHAPDGADGLDADDGLLRATRYYSARFRDKLADWRNLLAETAERGQRLVVWGAGSKGVTFLNMLRDAGSVDYVVDINPRKHGMYVAGTGQKIVGPQFLQEYKPHTVIVVNPVYRDEIRSRLGQMGVQANVLVA